MRVLTRYRLELLVRSQRWLPPVLAYLLLMGIGVTAGDDPSGILGWQAGVLLPVTVWLVRCAVTVEPAASRACLVTAAGAARVHLSALLAALVCGLALACAGTAAALAVGARPEDALWRVAGAGLLAGVVAVLLGVAVGALTNRPVLLGSQYGIPLGLAAATLVVAAPGSPANLTIRTLVTGSRHGGVELLPWPPVVALLVAAAATAGAALVARRRAE
ncbi:ABC transporter [Kitasatospora sp. NBC_00374]|uniref:ABC transporter n=1 Tax=Kitasatospora sp. NBC_00374 TaxID=2975964 RepID=UPI00324F6322